MGTATRKTSPPRIFRLDSTTNLHECVNGEVEAAQLSSGIVPTKTRFRLLMVFHRSQCFRGVANLLSQRKIVTEHRRSCRLGEAPHAMRGPYIEREQTPKTSARTIAGEDCHGYTDHRFRVRGQPRGVEGKGAIGGKQAANPEIAPSQNRRM